MSMSPPVADGLPVLSVRGLYKRYGRTVALDGFDLDLATGETVVLMGPSGCGKSTALRCMSMLTPPDAGTVDFLGRDLVGLSPPELREARRKIGFVFQHFNLIRRLTALENVAIALVMRGVPVEEALLRARAALERVELADLGSRYPDEMSGGEMQRVGIARAIAIEPVVMLWDEPTALLDPILIAEVLDIMEDLAGEHRTTMLVVTHEMRFAARAADRIVLVDKGKVVESGRADEVLSNPSSELGRRYRRLRGLSAEGKV